MESIKPKKYFYFWRKPHTHIEEEIEKYSDLIEWNKYITTKTEAYFFRKLEEYIKDKDYIICPKVRVWDIIKVKTRYDWFRPASLFWRTETSHIDFVLIWKTDLQIRYAIELDDPSHESEKAHERDNVKDKLFFAAKIPLIRFDSLHFNEHQFIEKGIL